MGDNAVHELADKSRLLSERTFLQEHVNII